MTTPVKQQQENRRQAKLEDVRRMVDEGSLVIRKMTSQERAQYPPRPPRPPKQKRP